MDQAALFVESQRGGRHAAAPGGFANGDVFFGPDHFSLLWIWVKKRLDLKLT
jgi:hypothetical protein